MEMSETEFKCGDLVSFAKTCYVVKYQPNSWGWQHWTDYSDHLISPGEFSVVCSVVNDVSFYRVLLIHPTQGKVVMNFASPYGMKQLLKHQETE